MSRLSEYLPSIAPRVGLEERVNAAVARVRARSLFMNRLLSGATALGALASFGISSVYAYGEAKASGFLDYVSLAFSADAFTYPRELGLALVESAPVALLGVMLAAVVVLVFAIIVLIRSPRPAVGFFAA